MNELGAAVLPVWVPWKPISIEPPGLIVPLYGRFRAVTRPLAGAKVAFQLSG